MKKARFKTKLTRKQKRRNILVFLAVFIGCYTFTLLFSYAIGVFDHWSMAEIFLLGLAMTFFVISMTLFPVIVAAVMLGLQRGRAKRVRDDSTYMSAHDIEYYRDNLRETTPALASLLVDLDIYGQKDIVATLLRMQNKKVISFQQNGGVAATIQGKGKLDEGECELLNFIMNGKLQDKKALAQWKQNRFHEAEQLGYIRKIDGANKNIGVKTLLGVLSFVLSLCLWGAFLALDFHLKFTSPVGAVTVFLFLLVIDFFLFAPFYLLCREVAYKKRGDVLWERTPLGNEITEKIAGMSRFIHDFSLLSEAKKEQVTLWNDYLIYAIVLEENEQIVEEACRQYKIKLPGLR